MDKESLIDELEDAIADTWDVDVTNRHFAEACADVVFDRLKVAEDLLPVLVEALERLIPPAFDEQVWWCPTCQDIDYGSGVNYDEYHVCCGTYLGDCQPNADQFGVARKALAKVKDVAIKTNEASIMQTVLDRSESDLDDSWKIDSDMECKG